MRRIRQMISIIVQDMPSGTWLSTYQIMDKLPVMKKMMPTLHETAKILSSFSGEAGILEYKQRYIYDRRNDKPTYVGYWRKKK